MIENKMTRKPQTLLLASMVIVLLRVAPTAAQVSPESTRFAIIGAPILAQPEGEFKDNVGRGYGAGGGMLYHLDRSGLLSLRFDFSGSQYGSEKKTEPISQTIGQRVLVDVTTTNSIWTLSFGPEFEWPHGPVHPYVNTGFSELFFRTSTSLKGSDSSDNVISTTNQHDAVAAWVLGGGLRVPFSHNPRKPVSLDLGVRYHRGGVASYLREGSIRDLPDGSIIINPLTSRTPTLIYMVGVQVRIPHNPSVPCPRFVC
jgi:hypothetical protein